METRTECAVRAAEAGAETAAGSFRTDLSVETKAGKTDVVTETDRATQRRVIEVIEAEFGGEPIVGEEDDTPAAVPEEGPGWIVDPIDGTANFVRGIQFFATSVAAVSGGEPVGVATYLPAQEDIYAASHGTVTLNDAPVTVSSRTDPETFAVALVGWWPAREGDSHVSMYRAAAERFGDVRRVGCIQGVLALVASGSLDGAFMPTSGHPWDTLAGVHLIRRAGGTVTDVFGERWHADSRGLVVSNGACHEDLLAAVQAGVEPTD